MKTEERLDILIRARYPIIYLVSHEERRSLNMIKGIAKKLKKELKIWSCTRGWKAEENDEGGDPVGAMDEILAGDTVANIISVILDYDQFMNNPMVIRKLRDVYNHLKDSFSTVIILSPVLKIPKHLEKEITVIDYTLPGTEELQTLLQKMTKQLNDKTPINMDKETQEAMIQAAQGLTLPEAENAFARSIVENKALNKLNPALVMKEKEQEIRKSGFLEFYPAKNSIDDIGGLEELKTWLKRRGRAFTSAAVTFGLPQPRGILLLGVQGCGKSLTAKAVANLWNLPLLRLDVGKIYASLVGESENNVRQAIKTAEAIAPCILWIDEVEKAFAGSRGSNDSGVSARVFGTLLTWLQEKDKPVFVVATANDITSLPPELLRKGRLDEIFFVDLPSKQVREEILKIHIIKRGRKPGDYDLEYIAEETDTFSGAELEEVVVSALFQAFDEDIELEQKHLLQSARETRPLAETAKEVIDGLRKWAKGRTRTADAIVKASDSSMRKLEV